MFIPVQGDQEFNTIAEVLCDLSDVLVPHASLIHSSSSITTTANYFRFVFALLTSAFLSLRQSHFTKAAQVLGCSAYGMFLNFGPAIAKSAHALQKTSQTFYYNMGTMGHSMTI
ncbi:hypothetical protein Ct61P_15507 [Colletotrichum tofieldiae]|nr:hypothetical protein Ct61P_15507 [Colletotrichum tofieldiae]